MTNVCESLLNGYNAGFWGGSSGPRADSHANGALVTQRYVFPSKFDEFSSKSTQFFSSDKRPQPSLHIYILHDIGSRATSPVRNVSQLVDSRSNSPLRGTGPLRTSSSAAKLYPVEKRVVVDLRVEGHHQHPNSVNY